MSPRNTGCGSSRTRRTVGAFDEARERGGDFGSRPPTHTPRIVLAIFAGAGIVVPLLLLTIQLGHSPPG